GQIRIRKRGEFRRRREFSVAANSHSVRRALAEFAQIRLTPVMRVLGARRRRRENPCCQKAHNHGSPFHSVGAPLPSLHWTVSVRVSSPAITWCISTHHPPAVD